MNDKDKRNYLKHKQAVDLYIDGVNPKTISNLLNIPSCEIIRYVKRCMSCDSNGNLEGYHSLIPNKKIISKVKNINQLFFKYPLLESFIIGNYFGDKKYTLEHNISIRTLHNKLLKECIRLGIQDYEYPFNLKDKGYHSLYLYIQEVENNNQELTVKRLNKNNKQKFQSTGYGESFNINSLTPYNIVQIDGHKIDVLYTVDTENEQGEIIPMPATRCWLIAVVDTATRAVIGYSVSPYENYNQSDVLAAISNSIKPHVQIEFKNKCLCYPENGGFPSVALPELEWSIFDMIMLDNAKSHLADDVLYKLTDVLKTTVNFGSVATPETRGIVERFFNTLETQGFHRLPFTTGSNSSDVKRNNPEKQSAKYMFRYDDILELLEFLIAEYNNSAHSSLENQTPLQVMERRVRQAKMKPYVIPHNERANVDKLKYFIVERTLRGGYRTGTKPQVSYLGVKYHAVDGIIPMKYIGQKVYLEVNPDDVSHVSLFNKDGVFIAELIAMGEWGRVPHSLKTHQDALKRKNQNKMQNASFSPDLTAYEDELKEKAKSSRRLRTKMNIVKSEKKKEPISNKQPMKHIIYSKDEYKNDSKDITEEEIDLLDSMSIEEAYKKGLI